MENNIPSSVIFGIILFVSIYLFTILIYLNIAKYDYFFISFLIGLFIVIFIFINNITKYVKLKEINQDDTNKLIKIQTCPEYWLKFNQKTDKDINVMCTAKNIDKTTSFASIEVNGEGENTWNSIKYKNLINLSDINKQLTNDKICERMFKYYRNESNLESDISNEYNDINKNAISWIEFSNNCIKSN